MGCTVTKEFDLSGLDPNNITLDHFEVLRVIGKGSFGKVNAVRRRDTQELFAMKTLDKGKIIDDRMLKNIFMERNLWVLLKHTLLINVHYAFQDDHYLYIIMDLMLGGDLRYHLNLEKRISSERCRFYAVQLVEAINYIHTEGFVHRDIKPDNILFDQYGNICLIDFNLTKKFIEGGLSGTAGTKPYMAPEVISKIPYGPPSDYWSLGISLFELITGETPFYHRKWNRMKYRILEEKVNFPDFVSDDAKALISGLLIKDQEKRWGYKEVKDCNWLKKFNFLETGGKLIPAPWKPNTKRANVSGVHDLDEQLEKKKKPRLLTEEEINHFNTWNYPQFEFVDVIIEVSDEKVESKSSSLGSLENV
jgi:serine/threonine kinase 32